MEQRKITINGNGTLSVPGGVQMQDFEISELFGVMLSTVRSNIRAILKAGIATSDLTNGATLIGNNILPDYHGLDMIMALAFRINSTQAKLFRRWILKRIIEFERSTANQPIFLSIDKSANRLIN